MKRIKIEIPNGIRYLLKWKNFKLSNFPPKCIINKQIPGCGFTEYCIRSSENIILCSPRKILLENKWDQHQQEVYLVRNEMDKDPNVDKDISKEKKDSSKQEFRTEEDIKKEKEDEEKKNSLIYQRISNEIGNYILHCECNNIPAKILVTYDSYRIVQQILLGLGIFQNFYTVIDEFQSILHDSRFKSDTELKFMNYLKRSHSAIFVSATPMMDEYLEMLSEFRDLPYYELDWYTQDPTRIIKPSLEIRLMRSVGEKAKEIIDSYLSGNFEEVVVMRNGVPTKIVSNEAVLYVNSVNHIISIIRKSSLQPEQANILCSNTDENKLRIRRKLGKDFEIGKVPKEGELHKMFTFCTRTVYLGADFYSTCARSFIFSDSNSDCLAVDISEDLPQILGRQRLFENPWKNQAEFYYRTTADYRKMDGDDFQKIIEKKQKATESLLRTFDVALYDDKYTLANTYQDLARLKSYKDDYVAVNKIINDKTGDIILKPVLNELVLVNEIRAFRIQQIDYKDRFTVFTTVHGQLSYDDVVNQEVSKFMEIYFSYNTRFEKMKILCEYGLSRDAVNIVLAQIPDSDEIKSYYLSLGPQKLKSLSYDITRIRRAMGIITFSPDLLKQEIYSNFNEGEKYTLSNLKNKLSSIYSSINYSSTPKANDIERWFEIKGIVVYEKDQSTGKRKQIRGYELIKSKRDILEEHLVD